MPIGDFEFIFMGTGTSAGVPVLACDCDVCTSDDPRDHRTRCGAALRFCDAHGHPRAILIDTTPDLRQQALRHHLDRCDAILYTHNHVDHTFGLDDVRRFNAVMKSPIDLYADGHTLETLSRVYRHIFDKQNNINDSFVATLIPHEIAKGGVIDLFGMKVTPLAFLHGRLPVLGFRFDLGEHAGEHPILPLAYCTDVSRVPPETWPHLVGVRTLVLDMLRYRAHPTHLNLDQALTIAGQVGAQRTFFTHMTHDISHAELDPQLPDGVALAYDGLVLGE